MAGIVIRLSCNEQYVELQCDPDAVYIAQDRAKWIAENGEAAFTLLFMNLGIVETIEAQIAELEAKGM